MPVSGSDPAASAARTGRAPPAAHPARALPGPVRLTRGGTPSPPVRGDKGFPRIAFTSPFPTVLRTGG
ncbi:hypothetical protein GCM10017562_62400 [Streptomyces roseofulvus]